MAGEIKRIAVQGRTFWTSLSAGRRAVLVFGLLSTIGAVMYFSLRDSVSTFSMLYSGLLPDDVDAMEGELRKAGIQCERSPDGTALRVPAQKLSEARILLASGGYPKKGGVGFEVFDKQGFGASGFVEQMNYRRALQGELERTIAGLGVVDSARVHIVVPERTLYRDNDSQASASVMVKLLPGRSLTPSQTKGIVNLVAFSVPGLTGEKVSLVDSTGRVLSDSVNEEGLDEQRDFEEALGRKVRTILERAVGDGHAEVQVTAEMDYTKESTTEELFDPEGAVVRSEQRTVESAGGAAPVTGGLAGARANLPGAPAPTPGAAADTGGNGRSSETRNYEISKRTHLRQGSRPKLKRIYVAILVDGVPDPNAKSKKNIPIVPRPEAELAKLAALAKQTVGYDESRGDKLEIQSAALSVPEQPLAETAKPEEEWPKWLTSPKYLLLLKGAGLFLALLAAMGTVVVLVRSIRLRQEETVLLPGPRQVRELEAQMGSEQFPSLPEPQQQLLSTPPSMSLPAPPPAPPKPRDLAIAAAKRDTTRTARVISSWLTEQGNIGGATR
ncbi:MAG: flagellar basal-body MS-ring/collar protein FliF [Pseudomonadota bacterium]